MKVFWTLLFLVYLSATACAYQPTPVQRSAAEQALTAALKAAASDSAKLALARAALAAHPDDIPLGRAAQDVLLRLQDDAAGFFSARAEGSESIAAHYLAARAADDTTVAAREAAWILAKDPKNFWGHYLAAEAEWSKAAPDLKLVERHYQEALAADPSRPEGYWYLGFLYEEQEDYARAREAFEAGAAADPAHQGLRDARLTVYAEQRDAKAYFDLFAGQYPAEPLTADMPLANREGRVETADLRGQPTVLEYWAYT